MFNAGSQIDGRALYKRQQQAIAASRDDSAPVIVATGLKTPDNIASVLRLADAVYSARVIFVSYKNQKIELDEKIKRISRNTNNDTRVEQYELNEFLEMCHHLPDMIAIEVTTQSNNIFDTQLPENCCLVIGSESHGVYDQVLQKCRSAVHIPMYGKNGSMNVSHALAISLYEWRRQTQ